MKEEWENIPGFLGYQVSSFGNVRSFKKRVGGGKWVISDKPIRILKPSICNFYRLVILSIDGKHYGMNIGKLVLMTFVGECPEGQEIRHLNGDSHDDRLINLTYGTKEQNFQDMKRHRRENPKRFISPNRILTDETVLAIRIECANGLHWKQLTDKYNLSCETIRRICLGIIYKDVGGPITTDKPHPGTIKKKSGCTSRYRGVSWHKTNNKWRSQIWVGGRCGKSVNIGFFEDEKEAAKAYDKKAIELHGVHAILNFPV